jgi:transcriptional regulator with XRE-family HTH domain
MPHTELRLVMTQEEKDFFVALGGRIAALRKEAGLTQTQLGEALGISQQHMASFEAGRRRVPVSALSLLGRALGVTVEDLLGDTAAPAAKRRGPAPKLQRQLERVSRLPRAQQRFVSDFLDTVLQQAGR